LGQMEGLSPNGDCPIKRLLGQTPSGSVPSSIAVKTLVIYLMCGAPTPELAEAAVEAGADVVELGFPFSDPLADGPVIRRAAERALAAGMRTDACLACLAEVRGRVDVPLIPMTYASLLEAFGYERFAEEVRAAGASSEIVADLPADARPDLKRVQLVEPTSPDQRIGVAADRTDGWLYLVTLTGTTGARDRHRTDLTAARRARSRRPRHRHLGGNGRATAREAGRRRHPCHDGRLLRGRVRRPVPSALPRVQHDLRPRNAGRPDPAVRARRAAPHRERDL